jgi:hypothetical protein
MQRLGWVFPELQLDREGRKWICPDDPSLSPAFTEYEGVARACTVDLREICGLYKEAQAESRDEVESRLIPAESTAFAFGVPYDRSKVAGLDHLVPVDKSHDDTEREGEVRERRERFRCVVDIAVARKLGYLPMPLEE